MIGDTPYDAEAASEAGTAAAGVLTGGFSINSLRGAGCFAIADEISRLLETLRDAKPLARRREAADPGSSQGGKEITAKLPMNR